MTTSVKNQPADMASALIHPNGNYKADRRIVGGLQRLAEKGTCAFLDDAEDPCSARVTVVGGSVLVEYSKPDTRTLDYGARHLAEVLCKLISGEISPDEAASVRVNSCMLVA